ncbi:MAG: flippase [Candidatus Woesearchaeota archaeon]
MASYARKAIHGTVTVFVLSLLAALAAYFFRLLLARKLSIEDYGLFFALFSFINLLNLFKDFGVGYAILKFIPCLVVTKKWGQIKSLIITSFVIQFISAGLLTIILIVAAPWLMEEFIHSSNTTLFVLFAWVFFISFPQNAIGVCFQGFQRMLLFSLQDLLRNVIVLTLTLLLIRFGFGIKAPIWAYLAMYIIMFVFSFSIFTTQVFPKFWKVKAEISHMHFRALLMFGLPAMLSLFGTNILQYTDTLVLTYFRGLTSVGLYQVAVPLAALVLYFSNAASAVITPLTAELMARKKRAMLCLGIELLHKYLLVIVIPFASLFVAFPEIFIRIFFGEKFLAAAPALQILAVGAVLCTIGYVNLNVLFGLGKPMRNTFVMGCTVISNILLTLLLIPSYDIVGAALATTTSYFLMLILSLNSIRKSVKIHLPIFALARVLIAALAFIAILAIVKRILVLNPLIELCVSAVAGSIVYILALFVLHVITRQDIKWLYSIIGFRLK